MGSRSHGADLIGLLIRKMQGFVNYYIDEAEENYVAIRSDVDIFKCQFQKTLVQMKDPTWDVVDLKFDERGLLVVDHASKVQFDDPITEEQKKLYEVELETLLKKELQHVSEIIFFDHNLRNSKKSVSCRTNPATHVHCDFSYETGVSEARKILGDKADDWFRDDGHVGIVNVWRPVGCTVEKNPLGLMDVKSLREEDKVQVRLLYGEDCPVGFQWSSN